MRPKGELKPPVAWLLGPQLIASLRSISLFAIAGNKLDPRDWMTANVISFREGTSSTFWFDYLADTGDGQTATYSIAYLCLSSLDTAGGEPSIDTELTICGDDTSSAALPRGTFLVVGGDTAYHVASYPTLAERFQHPFTRAAAHRGIDDQSPRRPLFGIPGNHDYYDAIVGFNRQFREPLDPERDPSKRAAPSAFPPPPLEIPGFQRRQSASYFALELPFGWWFWGVDNEIGDVDIRQQHFFRAIGSPKKLIVATPEPSTVLRHLPDENHKVSKAFRRLGLTRPFLGETLSEGHCRLDISGDTHHYERYWGPGEAPAESSDTYASVVAGMGGAFLHPSHAAQGPFREQKIYPSPDESRKATADALFEARNIVRGGFVWLIGAIVAVIAYVSTLVEDARPLRDSIFGDAMRLANREPFGNLFVSDGVAFRQTVDRAVEPAAIPLRLESISVVLALAMVGLLAAGMRWVRFEHHSRRTQHPSPQVGGVIALLSAVGLGCALVLGQGDGRPTLLPALLLLLSFAWSGVALAFGIKIADWLFDRARRHVLSRYDYTPVAICVALACLAPGVALGSLGRSMSAARLGLDLLVVATWLGVGLGLIVAAVTTANSRAKWQGKTGFGCLGAWHAAVQLGLPLLLARFGNPISIVSAMALTLPFGWVGRTLAKGSTEWHRMLLVTAWVAYGFALGLSAILLPARFPISIPLPSSVVPWAAVAAAAALGSWLSCVSCGWYFAVSLAFGGHVNEAGGAARIERFKQFIRFRLTQDTLTGFVIAIDTPEADGKNLKPKIIDVFTIKSPLHPIAAAPRSSDTEAYTSPPFLRKM